MSLTVINDLHIGAIRSGGTTPATAWQLREYLLDHFNGLLSQIHGDLMINGDLFDTTNIPLTDLFSTLMLLQTWLLMNPTSHLWLVPGNHDLSKNREMFSSFDFLANALTSSHPNQVSVPREGMGFTPTTFYTDMWVIPHVPNQDLFELELAKVPPGTPILFLHCNYDNGFAMKSDHSLNLSAEQAEKLPVKRIIIAHEHQAKQALEGKVIIVGNQFPSSIADCLGNDNKVMLQATTGNIEYIETWNREGSYVELEWTELAECANSTCQFIRVVGQATTAQAAEVVAAISKFRQASKALVITNAVLIEGMDLSEAAVSLEQVKGFNIQEELLAFLDEDQRAVVTKLLEKQ